MYEQLVSEMIVAGPEDVETGGDHPLNLNPASNWQSYFRDNEVLLQIDKVTIIIIIIITQFNCIVQDVRRLCPDLTFFQSATAHPNPIINSDNNCEKLYSRVNQAQLVSQVELSYYNVAICSQKFKLFSQVWTIFIL